MADPNRDDSKAFKTIIEAFDQMNKERSHIINNQGKVIADFSEKLAKYKQNGQDNQNEFREIKTMIDSFNKGDLFAKANVQGSFGQMSGGRAKSAYVESVTGDKLGTNSLLKIKPLATTKEGKVAVNDKEFTMPKEAKEPPSRDTIGNIVLPPGSNPPPVPDPTDKSDKSMGELWAEHEKKRREFIDSGHTKE